MSNRLNGELAEAARRSRDTAAEQARKPLDERVDLSGSVTPDPEETDLYKSDRETECLRWEAIAEKQLEAAQTFERAVEEFSNEIRNFEGTAAKIRG